MVSDELFFVAWLKIHCWPVGSQRNAVSGVAEKERGIRHEPVSGLQSLFNGWQLRCEPQVHVDVWDGDRKRSGSTLLTLAMSSG